MFSEHVNRDRTLHTLQTYPCSVDEDKIHNLYH